MPPTLHVLSGPTAVGKTEWALRWAETHDAEIVSADSLLFYRGMDIGTAKPTQLERSRVPHHLIDVRPVDAQMDVSTYVELARAAVNDIAARGRSVLVTGGSGFYLKSFFAPVVDEIEVPDGLRAEVRGLSLELALARLHALNPGGLGALDVANPRRVARALERCLASGRTLHELAAEFARLPAPYAGWLLELTILERDPLTLEQRIAARVAQMLADGLVDEVRSLQARGLEKNSSAAGAIGYREVLAMFAGELPPDRLASEIIANTRALVKKQRTWFRTQVRGARLIDAATLDDASALFS